MRLTKRCSPPIAWVIASLLLCGCEGMCNFFRDPAGDDRIFAGNLSAFIGKEVVVQFRWGDRRVYGEAITCVVLRVDENDIIVRALHMETPSREQSFSKLKGLGKLIPVEGEPEVFRIPRNEISRVFESAAVLQRK